MGKKIDEVIAKLRLRPASPFQSSARCSFSSKREDCACSGRKSKGVAIAAELVSGISG